MLLLSGFWLELLQGHRFHFIVGAQFAPRSQTTRSLESDQEEQTVVGSQIWVLESDQEEQTVVGSQI